MTALLAFFLFSTNHHRRAIASFLDVLPSSHLICFIVLGIYNEKTNVVDNTQFIQSIARNVLRIKSLIYQSGTEFPPCSYRIFIPLASRIPSALETFTVIVNCP